MVNLTQTPICTIAIPVYNRSELIKYSLESALSQDISNIEILVVDNCSTDDTWELLNSYKDSRLRLIRNESNIGMFGNFNRCLELATGKYLRILCSDDYLENKSLKKEIEYMEKYPSAALLTTSYVTVNKERKYLSTSYNYFKPGIYKGKYMIYNAIWICASYNDNLFNYPSGVLIRRDAAMRCGLFDNGFNFTADLDYWLRLLEFGDLIILHDIGCSILEHSGREANSLFLNGCLMHDKFEIARRRKRLLQSFDDQLFSDIMKKLAGYCFWYVLKTFAKNQKESANIHLKMIDTYGISYADSIIFFLFHVIEMLRLRMFCNHRVLFDSEARISYLG